MSALLALCLILGAGPTANAGDISRGLALTGRATWYAAPSSTDAAAGPALRVGKWRGEIVETCLVNAPTRCVSVKLSDFCRCPGRLIDLPRGAFAKLADPSVGVISVSVSSGKSASDLPPTDSR